jgi:hypothetical protein
MAYVYVHIRKDNNKPFYIGVGGLLSFDNYQRANSENWKGLSHRSDFWKNVVSKYGFTVEIVLDNCTKEEAFLEEQRLITFYGRKDIGTGILVNHTAGGEGRIDSSDELKKKCGVKNIGRNWTPEQRNKIMEKRKDRLPDSLETRLKKSLSSKGKPKSKDHIEKIKQLSLFKLGHTPYNKGQTHSKETKIKMSLSSGKKVINTLTGEIYESALEASKTVGMNYSTFRDQITNRRNIKNKTNFKYYE